MHFAPIYGKVERKVDAFCADLWKSRAQIRCVLRRITKKSAKRTEISVMG